MSDILAGENRIACVVANRAFTRIGPGPIASCLSLEVVRRLSAAGSWTATFPGNDPRTQLLLLKQSLVRWTVDGVHVCTGIVEHSAMALSETGERILTVSGRDMLGELAETPLGFFELGATNTTNPAAVPSTNAVQAVFVHMAGYDGTVWTGHNLAGTTPVSTGSGVVASFAGESALAGLVKIAEHIGEQFRVYKDGTRRLTWLGTTTPASGVRAVGHAADATAALANPALCFIQSLEVERDGYELITRVYPYGAGQGHARLNILNHTRTDPTGYATIITGIANTAQETLLGKVVGRYVEFKDIRPVTEAGQTLAEGSASLVAAKNQLYDAGLAYLRANCTDSAVTTYRLAVSHIPETLDVGTTLRVLYADDVYSLDTDLVVTEMRSRYGAGTQESHELTVSPAARKPVTDVSEIVGSLGEAKVFQAHPQLNANGYTTGYRVYIGDNQTTGKGELRFWFGDEVVQLERVLLRFNLAPVVSFSATIGGETEVALVISGTVDIPDHDHNMSVIDADPSAPDLAGTSRSVYVDVGTNPDRLIANISGTDPRTPVDVNTTEDGGGHTNLDLDVSGTVDLSGALTTSYGVFRAGAIDTYAIADLEYSLNGGTWTALNTAAVLGAGWYQLDLTAGLYDANFRPVNEQNVLEIRRTSAAATGKSVMMDAFLRVREIIQGNALS